MSVISMEALHRKKATNVSLLLIADDPTIVRHLRDGLPGSEISFAEASVLEFDHLFRAARYSDLLIFHVDEHGIDHILPTLVAVRDQFSDLKIFTIDSKPTPERAVAALKAGASDYLPHRGDGGELLDLVEGFCLDKGTISTVLPALSGNKRGTLPLQSLNDKVRNLAKAAGYLATCNNLQEVCEGLLISLGKALGATGGSLYLKDADKLKRVHSLDPGHAPNTISLPLEKGTIFEQVYSTGEPVLITGKEKIRRRKLSGWDGYEANNLFVYPLVQKNGEPIGILSLHGKRDNDFTQEDRDLVLILAAYSHETIRALLAHEKLTTSLDSLRLTFENMNQGIVLLNEAGEIVHFNQKLLSIARLNETQISVGQNISGLLDVFRERGDLEGNQKEMFFWNLFDEDAEYLLRCKSGVMVNIVGNHIHQGGYVLTFTDITKQKEWENQLFQAKEKAEAASVSKTSFLANVSHELRTPLNAIIGFAEMINKEVFGPVNNQKYEEYVKHIHDSGSHLLRLINNLLDLSKVEAGKFIRKDGDVNISELIENTMMYFSGQASDNGINLTLIENAEIGIIQADVNALRQILLNLLSNALKFTPKGGEVTVSADLTDQGILQITVQDTGIGIAEKSIAVALQPFGQVENTFNRKYPGTGLGLPLVVSLVELHGGQFDIQSALGDGTTCRVSIPVTN